MKLSTAVHDFKKYLRMEGKADATITAYMSDCNLLSSLATVHGGDSVLAFTPELVREYFLMLSRRDLKMSTLHRRRASISEFARYCVRERLVAADPMTGAPSIKKPHRLPQPFSHPEQDRLMSLPLTGEEKKLRALFFYAGLRVTEAVSVRLRDAIVGDDDHPATLRVRGKGNKERVIPMFPELRAILYDDFLARVQEPLTNPVVRRGDGRKWTRKMAEKRARRWGLEANVADCHPHRFRHSCATRLHELGWQIRDIANFLGHADIATTMLYADSSPQHMLETARLMPLRARVISPDSRNTTGGAS